MAVVVHRFIFLVLLIGIVQGRILRLKSSDDHLISDGVESQESPVKTSTHSGLSTTSRCTHEYGFLPCAENTAGDIFLILMYQLALVFGEIQIGTGTEVLFHNMAAKENTGVEKISGVIFRFLMSLPSMILMIASGIFSTKENAQSQVSAGVGTYAGNTVFSLTIQWGMCVIYAGISYSKQKSDENGENKGSKCSQAEDKFKILKEYKVEFDPKDSTCYDTARFMLLSLIPYAIVQLANVFNTSSGKRIITLISLIVSTLFLLSYFAYQIRDPWKRKKSLHHHKKVLWPALLDHMRQLGQLQNEDGKANTDVIKGLFAETDTNKDKRITADELGTLIDKISHDRERTFNRLSSDFPRAIELFDLDCNRRITEEEFIKKCKCWIETHELSKSRKIFHEALLKISLTGKRAFIKSVLQILLGLVILLFLGGPLMSSIQDLSYARKFPSFSISFIVVPWFMNLRVAIAALFPGGQSEESKKTASLTFSEIYDKVVMNNLTGLTALLAIVFAKDLTWDFSAEVLTILVVCAVIGIIAEVLLRWN